MAIFTKKETPRVDTSPIQTPSLSRWNQRSELKSFSIWLAFLFLLAFSMYYVSRPDPAELQRRAMKVMNDLRQLEEQKGSDAQSLNLLLTQLETEENRNFTRGIWQHLSHALFVACFLIIAVEVHTRRVARRDMQRHVDDVTRNVFQGVSQRLLGERISAELRSILREDFVKERAGYQITFEGTPDNDQERVIVRQESWYDVRNLTGERQDFPFRTSLLGFDKRKVMVNGRQEEFPYFVSVTIDDQDQPITQLQDSGKPDPLFLQKTVPFTREIVSVKIVTRMLFRLKDAIVLSSSHGMERSEITVSNGVAHLVGKCDAVVLHKHTERVRPRTSGQWEFDRALLPGQGWYVYWEPKETTPASQTQQLGDNNTVTHEEPPKTIKV
jgi:hypothetical protein